MRLTVFGATGGIGRHILGQAVAAGHDVTAVARSPQDLSADVRAIRADLAAPEPAALQAAVNGVDAVLSGLGPRNRSEVGIVSQGTRAIVDAMRSTGGGRLVVVSGAGVSTVPTPNHPNPPRREPGAGFLNRYVNTPLARRAIGKHFVDVALMEDLLYDSGLDWTAVRVPLLVNKPATGAYRTVRGRNVRRGFRLGRADAAHFILRVIEQPDTFRQAISVAY
jgi:nucleoside-diphosphate-sugar epimerase